MDTDDSMLEQVLGLCDSFAAMARAVAEAMPRAGEPVAERAAASTGSPPFAWSGEPSGSVSGFGI